METFDWRLAWAIGSTVYGLIATFIFIPIYVDVKALRTSDAVHSSQIKNLKGEVDKLWQHK